MEPTTNIKPRFEVHKLHGTRTHVIYTPREKGGFDTEEVEEDAGYMVYFPTGSSIRVRTEDELKAMGFVGPALLVDMESGDIVGQTGHSSLKALSEQKAKPTRSERSGNGTRDVIADIAAGNATETKEQSDD